MVVDLDQAGSKALFDRLIAIIAAGGATLLQTHLMLEEATKVNSH